jgi:Fe-S cluster assembly protein SufD
VYTPELVQQLEGHGWLMDLRRQAAVNAIEFSYPSHEDEEWRYSPIEELELDLFTPALAKPQSATEIGQSQDEDFHNVLTVDGFLLFQDEVSTCDVHSASGQKDPITFAPPIDMLGSMNLAFSPDPVFIRVPRGSKVERPLVIHHQWNQDGAACFPLVHVEVEENTEIEIVEIFHNAEVSSLVIPGTRINVGNGSNVNYQQVQNLNQNVWKLGTLDVSVAQQATFQGAIAAIGGAYARLKTSCSLNGRGASGKISAIYHGDNNQVLDFRTHQRHVARDTYSELLFKGVLDDESNSIYTGLIQVAKEASGTNAFQTNRTLKLCDQAWAESVPNLEIENNDVKCSHASTVSPVDENQRFYLESRGVPTFEAEKLIVHGFLQEVVSSLPVEAINIWIAELFNHKLNARMAHSG